MMYRFSEQPCIYGLDVRPGPDPSAVHTPDFESVTREAKKLGQRDFFFPGCKSRRNAVLVARVRY